MSRVYTGDAIRKMAELLLTDSTPAYNWLMERDYRELIEAVMLIKITREASFKWLIDNKHFEIAAFANAVNGDKNAFRWLMQHKSVFWAATANAANKDKQAMEWLKSKGFTAYSDLAEAIIEFNSLSDDDVSGYFKGP